MNINCVFPTQSIRRSLEGCMKKSLILASLSLLYDKMDFYNSPYYKTTKRILNVCGLWPYQSNLKSILNNLIFIITTVSMAFAMVAGIYSQVNAELLSILEAAFAVLYCCGALLAYALLYRKKHEIRIRSELLAADWMKLSDDSERKIMEALYLEARNAFYVILGCGMPIYVLFVCITFLPRIFGKNSLQQCLRSFPYYYKAMVINENTCDLQVCVHFTLAGLLCHFIYLSVSSTYLTSVKHVCSLYSIARHRLRNAVASSIDSSKKSIKDTSTIPSLINVIDIHKEALRSIKAIEKNFSFGFFFLEIGALLLFTILVFEVNYHRGNVSELLRFIPTLLLFILYLFFTNWCGEQVIQSCEDLRLSAYNVDWYKISSRIRIFIFMIMQMTARPANLTAGTIMLLSIQNFATILRTAWSFGTLLLTMQKPGRNRDANFS